MNFNEWLGLNKNLINESLASAMHKAWTAGWQAAIEKHWMEAFEQGKKEGYNNAISEATELIKGQVKKPA